MTELKDYERRIDNTITTLYERFMEHFREWDEGKLKNREWEIIRRGFEAQAKIAGNLIRVLSFSSDTPKEFKDMCIGFGILPDVFTKKIPRSTGKKAE